MDFKIHAPNTSPAFKTEQARLLANDYKNGIDAPEEIVSIVKEMTFQFLELSSLEALARLEPYVGELKLPDTTPKEWIGPCLCLYGFHVLDSCNEGIIRVRTRLFDGPVEDPATGSAASALGGYLASKKGKGVWQIEVEQGVEMGRRSKIGVEVTIGEELQVQKIKLSGEAVDVMEGRLQI